MDDRLGRQIVPTGGHGLAGGAEADVLAFAGQTRPGHFVDGAAHAAPAPQLLVGRVDDDVGVLDGDVVLDQVQALAPVAHVSSSNSPMSRFLRTLSQSNTRPFMAT